MKCVFENDDLVELDATGTPTVADFAPAELGCVLRMSDGSACRLIGDALDLRHRLSKIWGAALSGQLPAYQARLPPPPGT